MTPAIEKHYGKIGQEALGIAEGLSGRLLVYATIWEDVTEVVVFYEHESGFVRARFR